MFFRLTAPRSVKSSSRPHTVKFDIILLNLKREFTRRRKHQDADARERFFADSLNDGK